MLLDNSRTILAGRVRLLERQAGGSKDHQSYGSLHKPAAHGNVEPRFPAPFQPH